jgi:putative oxidoreductase
MTTATYPWRAEAARRSSRGKNVFLWTLQIVSAALFLMAGSSKLAGVGAMVQMFAQIGIGQWFRYVTGAIEVVGAVLLLVPSLAFIGGGALAVTMIGAIVAHLFVIGGNPLMPILLLAATTTVLVVRGGER